MINPEQEFITEFSRIKRKVDLIRNEWDRFINTGTLLNDNVISAEVLSSWIRCRNRGLNPYNPPNVQLSDSELRDRITKNHKLIEIAKPFLQSIAENLEGSGFRVDLFDADLYLLGHFGDKQVLEDSKKKSLIQPGVNRSESTSGTNAINLAALLERPVQLLGPEHYNAALQHWTCSAVPIKDENGRIIAVINAAGYYWLIHRHTLGMMTAMGKSIEYCLSQRQVSKQLEKTNNFNKEIIESISDALIVVNKDGRVLMANKAAQNVLGREGFDITGSMVDSLWEYNNPFSAVINTEQPIIEKEISFSRQGKTVRLIGTIRPISVKEQGLQGVIGTFKAVSHTRGMIKDYVGWKAHFTFENLIGDSPEFRQAVRLAKETAIMSNNILIQGESGTGKDLFAQAIHNSSIQSEGPFVVINCAAIPNGLLESELFGYEGGAFTGAKKGGQPGKFELAEGGTIFLDEINSLPLDMQAKILRTLQNKTVIRVGGTEEIPIKVRVIAASNSDLWQMVKRGEFREDLFYRINVIAINIPPLRNRGNDLQLLIEHIVSTKGMMPNLLFDNDALTEMRQYDWPGNIRELENVLERSYVLAKARGSNVVTADDVLSYPGIKQMSPLGAEHQSARKTANIASKDLKVVEKEVIAEALAANNGNVTAAAAQLGVARNTLYRKMKRYGIL